MAEDLGLHPARPPPKLNIPPGASAKVQIIDTTSRIKAPIGKLKSVKYVPAFSFLVEQPSSGRKVVFDLGLRKDPENLTPAIKKITPPPLWRLKAEKNVAEILQENGIDVARGAIEAVIWSHWHLDHIGDVTTFPKSTALVTGAGVRDAFLPGYPKDQEGVLAEADFEGREHIEIDFGAGTKIGGFRGVDYFKDGSFYLLDAPGHAIGHVCGLARTQSTREGDAEDTFVFMGGDTCHFGGQFRPSAYLPLPKDIKPSPWMAKYPSSCPGHLFEAIHPRKKAVDPYNDVRDGITHDKEDAAHSVANMQDFDAAEHVFVVIAHDDGLLDPDVGIQWFPNGTMKDWKAKNQAQKVRWAFLKDFTRVLERSQKARI